MKMFLIKYWYLFLLVISIVGVWFLKSGYIFATDLSWGPNPKIDLELSHGTILQIFSWLGEIIGQPFAEKILITLPFVIIAYFGYKIGGNAIATLAIFNPFVYERLMVGQFNVLYAYSLTLGIIYLFKKWLYLKKEEKIQIKDIFIISILFSLSILSIIHSIFIVGFLIFMMAIVFYKKIHSDIFNNKFSIKEITKIFLIFFIPFIVFNSVWIYMILTKDKSVFGVVSNITEQDFKAFATVGSNFFERTWNIINLQGFWAEETNNYIIIKNNFLRFIPAMLVCGLAILGLFNLKNKNKWAFKILSISIVLIIILAQASSIVFIKDILYKIPFYSGLREPQKWVGLLTGIIILLIFIFITEKEKIKNINIKYYKYSIIAISFLWTPFLFFGGWGQVVVADYTEYYKDINTNLNAYRCYEGTMAVMPWHKYIEYSWVKKIVDNPSGFYFDCPVITGTNMEFGGIYDNSNSTIGKQISRYVLSGGEYPLPENIKTILLIKEADYKKYKFLEKYSIIKDSKDYTLYKVK